MKKSTIVKICKWWGVPESMTEDICKLYGKGPVTDKDFHRLYSKLGETASGVNNAIAANGNVDYLSKPSMPLQMAKDYRKPLLKFLGTLTDEPTEIIDDGLKQYAAKWARRPCDNEEIREFLTDWTGSAKTADRICKTGYLKWCRDRMALEVS